MRPFHGRPSPLSPVRNPPAAGCPVVLSTRGKNPAHRAVSVAFSILHPLSRPVVNRGLTSLCGACRVPLPINTRQRMKMSEGFLIHVSSEQFGQMNLPRACCAMWESPKRAIAAFSCGFTSWRFSCNTSGEFRESSTRPEWGFQRFAEPHRSRRSGRMYSLRCRQRICRQ